MLDGHYTVVAIAETTLTLPTKPSVHNLSVMLILWLLY